MKFYLIKIARQANILLQLERVFHDGDVFIHAHRSCVIERTTWGLEKGSETGIGFFSLCGLGFIKDGRELGTVINQSDKDVDSKRFLQVAVTLTRT